MNVSWPTPWSRISRSPSTNAISALAALLLFCAPLYATAPAVLKPVATRDRKIARRWSLSGTPHAVALGRDGTIYVGLARSQSIVAIDPVSGTIRAERVLDHEEIASTKEIVALRINARGDRLIAANGSDESVTILSLPGLDVLREIGLEGEAISDAIPDPQGRYLYVVGRRVHVFDADGESELRALEVDEPMAAAVTGDGRLLAVAGRQTFPSGAASIVALIDTATFRDVAREPLQTDRKIRALTFAANDQALVVAASDWLAEKDLVSHPEKKTTQKDGRTRLHIEFGDLVSSESICLPDASGPQVLARGARGATVHYAEKRCSASASFTAAPRKVRTASLYGVNAWAVAYDAVHDQLVASEPAGYLTIFKSPSPASHP